MTVIIGAVVMVGLAILATVMLRNVRSGPEGEGQSELTTAGAVAEGGGS